MNMLPWYYDQCKTIKDVVGQIVKLLNETGDKPKSRFVVIEQLLQQKIINSQQYNQLMNYENTVLRMSRTIGLGMPVSTISAVAEIDMKNSPNYWHRPTDDIQVILKM